MATRFTPEFLDDIRARLPVSQVVGRSVPLKKAGREWRGLSPFKSEKTPSFFVNDQKGFYHCFASGEHGDIFTFLMKVEGLSFPEAVERLAGDAGLQMPKLEARDPEVEDRRQRLLNLVEAAASFFEDRLASGTGREARSYLDRRGLSFETVRDFRIGYAPNSRTELGQYLSSKGFRPDEMAQSGMLIAGEDIQTPYDRFRNRVMFPITDLKGRVIAFGGRALDPDQPAKYLNSPETPLFHKGNVLFHFQAARQAAHTQSRLIAVEGYMDVAALHQAGICEAVAPLGTAMTEQQLALMWRSVDEPTLCFDGDEAGRKAAWRALDTALPHLAPGKSLMFAFLPDGLDPDDLLKTQGREALEAVLDQAQPLIEVLFQRAWQTGDVRTPERRARLEQHLRASIATISDTAVRYHYERDLKNRLWERFRSSSGTDSQRSQPNAMTGRRPGFQSPSGRAGAGQRGGSPVRQVSRSGRDDDWRRFTSAGASDSLRQSLAKSGGGDHNPGLPYREALLMAVLLNHPWLMHEDAEAIADLELTSGMLGRLRDALLSLQATEKPLDSGEIRTQLSTLGLNPVVNQIETATTLRCDRFVSPNTGHAEVRAGWRHALELHERQVGLRQALDAAERSWREEESEDAFNRIRELQLQLDSLASQTIRADEPAEGQDGPSEPVGGAA
jgi:DNA primase